MDVHSIAKLPLFEMQKFAQTLGNTPLKPIQLRVDGRPHTLHLKLEGANPTGSAKDRTGKSLIETLEAQGRLSQSSILVESTSGNLGAALSFLCKVKGYCFLAVVDPKTTHENIEKMRVLGAEIEMVTKQDQTGGYLLSRLERVQALCQSSQRYIWTNQYENLANPIIHQHDTGPEIYRQMNSQVDALFIAVSTGGTLAGISRFFRKKSPQTRIIGVDARGSVVFGAPPGPRLLAGIGSSRRSSFLTRSDYDEYTLVGDEEAFAFCRAVFAMTGICVGGSSGAVIAACVRYLRTHQDIRNVVCLCADRGTNYTSSIFDDQWMTSHGFSLHAGLPDGVQIDERASSLW
ncbi:MAG TPA: 2,3-diaminopropionate biosynthesis protein SbnA [Ktedonobacteraceae bacterium]|nr:2,3-diaminopropionate biosynthesis protein SbnA [Ktedonobacteraceae bacterium]